eukprot:CAMPEP_0183537180 /NCGR_PEP_ID=MMETSP0371-20130417/28757_1 /TAXON_ID=268820 /ORGANISM="Peridinium aciculiferum, Strain PAER-2" /LENGTH=33 /DNA_ID= /DNA_START= /DNA_END= /DNA_ORIENTATION=
MCMPLQPHAMPMGTPTGRTSMSMDTMAISMAAT